MGDPALDKRTEGNMAGRDERVAATAPRWFIKSEHEGTRALHDALDAGWEPFAVVANPKPGAIGAWPTIIYLRRQTDA